MSRRLKQVAAGVLVVFATAQLIRPEHANPPTDSRLTIQAHVGTASGLAPILHRACGDCHSNGTTWPWYTHIAPLSWLMVQGVTSGRRAVNFSEWAAYSPEQQRQLLAASCDDMSRGAMPGRPWTLLHPEARLSAQEIETICAAARQTSVTDVTRSSGETGEPVRQEQ